ncbi:hypothetical protein Mgra_00004691 [Meloidogyne graminicola]|uniref:Uncharacterized protein n=1 Tax=Meloidogyne graminicola TaxID=189291 RepID=A0A8S9ZRC6_9BILA|nr:hypothetical protein Mgra_00004691 [Meloidogyne graminicola]
MVILCCSFSTQRFVFKYLISIRSLSAISSINVRSGNRSLQNISLQDMVKGDGNGLHWSESFRLWNCYQPSHNEPYIGSSTNASMSQNYVEVSHNQQEVEIQNWWSVSRVTPIGEHGRLRNNHLVDKQSLQNLNKSYSHDQSPSQMGRKDESDLRLGHGKLLDPQHELREICYSLNNILFNEYTKDVNNLKTILVLADKMRESKVNKTPLLDLINRLGFKKEYHYLIPPLYNAFMKSPEVNEYSNRAEILLPAIAYAFQSTDQIKDVHLLFKQIHYLLERNKNPEYMDLLRFFVQIKFKSFIYELKQGIENKHLKSIFSALQIEEMASSLRECYPSPLTDSIDYVFRTKMGDDCTLHLYRAFLNEPSEFNLFADRIHIFFPWIIELLNENKHEKIPRPVLMNVLVKLLKMDLNSDHRLLPNFMVNILHNELGNLFDYACINRKFNISQIVWVYCKSNDMLYKFNSYSLFLFALHMWMNGSKKEARVVANVLQSRILFISKSSKDKVNGKLINK